MPDPERWVPDGYVIVVADTRGSGKSPGYLDPRQPRENQDYYELIEWAGTQPWSNGKVGLLGISYLAINQWKAAALQPPHLAAICPWEGHWDHYRDSSHHGGIFSNSFTAAWWPRQVLSNQHGSSKTHYYDPDTGERSTGPALSDEMLAGNREDHPGNHLRHKLNDQWHQSRTPHMDKVKVPLLSAGNWGGPGVHLRGNVSGFVEAASKQKWLSMHIGTHYESFYLPEYVAMQKRFFDRFLKDVNNGWDKEPPVRIEVRDVHGKATVRKDNAWPLPATQWTKFYLDAADKGLARQNPAAETRASYDAMGDGVSFSTAPFDRDFEITGYVSAHLTIASSTTDMDIFAVLRAFDPTGKEVVFVGAHEPTPVSRGWLRGIAPQAGCRAVEALPAVPGARRNPKTDARRPLHRRRRNLADQPGAPEGLSSGADTDGQGLRIRGHSGPTSAQPSGRSSGRRVRRHQHHRHRRPARILSAAAGHPAVESRECGATLPPPGEGKEQHGSVRGG